MKIITMQNNIPEDRMTLCVLFLGLKKVIIIVNEYGKILQLNRESRKRMIKLEKCPFCGGEAMFNTISEFTKASELGFYFKIKCTRCGIAFPMEGKVSLILDDNGTVRYTEDNRLELASKWNTRIMEEAKNE